MRVCTGQCTANSSGGFKTSRGRGGLGDDINIGLANRRPGQQSSAWFVRSCLFLLRWRGASVRSSACCAPSVRRGSRPTSPRRRAGTSPSGPTGCRWTRICAPPRRWGPRPPPSVASRRSNGMDKLELVRFFVRLLQTSKMSLPEPESGSADVFRKIVDDARAGRAAVSSSDERRPPVGPSAETVSETARPPQLRQVRPRRDGRDRVRRAPRGARPGHHEPLHGVHEGQAHGQRRPQGVGAPKAGSSAGSGRAWRRSRASGRRRPASRAWPRGTGPRWTRRGPRSSRRASAGPPRPS